MALVIPPPYSGHGLGNAGTSSSPPVYSTQPHADEETVAFTPRVGPTMPQGTFTRQWPQATLILKDQDEGTRLPTYGRHGRIVGEIGLQNTDKIVRVTVKLHGHMSLSTADTGSVSTTLISDTQVLWKHQPNDNPTQADVDQKCPSLLPVQLQFPYFYNVNGQSWRLPPTFEATFVGIPALFVRCLYTLSITITRTRSYHLASWTTNKTYVTMVNYRPRTRPSRPIVLLDSVFSSIKPVPEEWLQLVSHMSSRPKSRMRPIECHLFIPSVQTFSLTDTIPFHIQLCSSLKSLRELLPPSSTHLQLPVAGEQTKTQDPRMGDSLFNIRMSIARQVVVELNGRRRIRTFTIGVGHIWSVPPMHNYAPEADAWDRDSSTYRDSLSVEGSDVVDGDICLDWQGEVKCWGEVTSGGFSVGNLIVKLSHPIKLVTDSWVDIDALHPGDH